MKGNLEHVVERATDVADKLLPVLAHHVLPVLLAGDRTKDVNIITKMFALRNLPVGANVNHVVVGSTLFTILRRKTQVVNFSCRFITCITPYSFIGFTPYSLVCLNGHVLLPWIFDLQELWVRQSRREVENLLAPEARVL